RAAGGPEPAQPARRWAARTAHAVRGDLRPGPAALFEPRLHRAAADQTPQAGAVPGRRPAEFLGTVAFPVEAGSGGADGGPPIAGSPCPEPGALLSSPPGNPIPGHGWPRMVSIVVPCLNEEAVLPQVYTRLCAAASTWGEECEFLLIDDGSTDRTWERVRAFS